jgi:flavorubredoxin
LTAGHSVNIERLETVGAEKTNEKDVTKIQLKTQPDVSSYDGLIFGGPVQGASISPVLSAYLTHIVSLKNKKVVCLVTEFFPYPWMGGDRAITQMKNTCESKGASIIGTGIVNWMSTHREKRIADVVEKLSRLF